MNPHKDMDTTGKKPAKITSPWSKEGSPRARTTEGEGERGVPTILPLSQAAIIRLATILPVSQAAIIRLPTILPVSQAIIRLLLLLLPQPQLKEAISPQNISGSIENIKT